MFPNELQDLQILSEADSSGPIFVPNILVGAPFPIAKISLLLVTIL